MTARAEPLGRPASSPLPRNAGGRRFRPVGAEFGTIARTVRRVGRSYFDRTGYSGLWAASLYDAPSRCGRSSEMRTAVTRSKAGRNGTRVLRFCGADAPRLRESVCETCDPLSFASFSFLNRNGGKKILYVLCCCVGRACTGVDESSKKGYLKKKIKKKNPIRLTALRNFGNGRC